MRKTIARFGAALLIAAGAVSATAGTIDDELQAVLSETPADQSVSAIVFLSDRVDIDALEAEFTRLGARLQFRHEKVVTELQQKAAATQGDLLAYIAEREAASTIESHHAFWISNAIVVKAPPAEILSIADREDVGTVFFDYEIELIKPVEGIPGVRGDGPVQMGDITSGVLAVRAPEVWDIGFDGTGVLVSTLDTGVDGNHEALASRWRGLDPEYADDPEWAWFDPVTNTRFPEAFGSHGTRTMGSVCGGPPGEQIGVAPGAQWIHAAVIGRVNTQRTVQDALLAFEWLIDPDGNPDTNFDVPAVNSNSWGLNANHGYPPCDETFWDHIAACEAAGIVVIFSAGNSGTQGLVTPADRATNAYDSCAVAAVDANVEGWPIAGFSSRGPTNCTPSGDPAIKPDIAAPGVNVRTAWPDNEYGNSGGTSMASPHVNGVIALVRQANPDLPTDQVKQIIYDTAFDLGDPEEDNDYGWGMVDAFEAVQIAISRLANIRWAYPDGRPARIDPNGGTRMRVEVLPGTEDVPQPGTGVFHYFENGDWVDVPMEQIEDNVYDAVFPSVACAETLRYYLSAETTDGDDVTDPFTAPDHTHSAESLLGIADFFSDDFEDDLGWTVVNEGLVDGEWERGVPYGRPQNGAPEFDSDGSGKCWVTGNVLDQDVDGGPTRLISPAFDMDGGIFAVKYAKWFSFRFKADPMTVEVSNDDGETWVLMEEWDRAPWFEVEYNVGDFVTPSSAVRFRFSAEDYGQDSRIEAGLDAFRVFETLCGEGGCLRDPAWQCDGDVDGDGQVNPVDVGLVQAAFGSADDQDLCNYDLDCDGQINPVDSGIVLSLFGTCEEPREVCP